MFLLRVPFIDAPVLNFSAARQHIAEVRLLWNGQHEVGCEGPSSWTEVTPVVSNARNSQYNEEQWPKKQRQRYNT